MIDKMDFLKRHIFHCDLNLKQKNSSGRYKKGFTKIPHALPLQGRALYQVDTKRNSFFNLRSAERLHIILRLAQSHSGRFFLYRIRGSSQLRRYFSSRSIREEFFEQAEVTLRPYSFRELFRACFFLLCHYCASIQNDRTYYILSFTGF